jgi:hypothetical protein
VIVLPVQVIRVVRLRDVSVVLSLVMRVALSTRIIRVTGNLKDMIATTCFWLLQ